MAIDAGRGRPGRTAILACVHVNGPGGRLIQPRITIHVTFARFSQRSDDGVLCITLKLA